MARKIRIEHEGAAYHVMARGNQGRDKRAVGDGRQIKSDAGHFGRVKRDGQPELERLTSPLEPVYESKSGEVEVRGYSEFQDFYGLSNKGIYCDEEDTNRPAGVGAV